MKYFLLFEILSFIFFTCFYDTTSRVLKYYKKGIRCSGDDSVDLYSGGACFESGSGHQVSRLKFSWFPSVTEDKCRNTCSTSG
jgi:hypothetical protein